jgi:protein involved in polysaccharide export with SLBB domain
VPAGVAELLQSNNSAAYPYPSQRTQEGPHPTVEALQAEERTKLQDVVDQIRTGNPYELNASGQLLLPGFAPMTIAGLTEDLASRRVTAEPALEKLIVRLTRLPLQKSGQAALKPFGYDLFNNSVLSLLPMYNTPVPADYVIGPGDLLQVQLFGSQNQTLSLAVHRDGVVSFPQLGPIPVAGRRYSEIKSDIESRVARQMIGVHANVSMGETRTINVFVLGEAKYPGSYTVSGLATVTTALFAAGGVETAGSLRNIQVKRQGATVRTLDLYDFLMRGDSSNDIQLLPGDVVFIPPVGPTVSLDGEVLRPAIYELRGSGTVADLIQMGGGLTPNADRGRAALVRIDAQQRRVVLNVEPSASTLEPLHNGDVLNIARLRPQLDSGVTVQGYVYRPKYFAWHEGVRLSEVIPTVDELKPGADQHYLLIRRELPPNRHIVVLSADLSAALHSPGSVADVVLMPRDTITVFDLQSSRQYVIEPIMDELRLQSNLAQPTEIVHVDGQVKVPGDYPLEPGMRVADLIRAGGSLGPTAYAGRAELSRFTVVNGEQRETQVLAIDLSAVRSGDPNANLLLEPFDRLSVKQISEWTEQNQVTLSGEVRFPGIYTIQPGETMHSVLDRAGGLTEYAFPQGSVFIRAELKRQEQDQLDRYAQRMKLDISESELMAARGAQGNPGVAVSIGESLLSQLQSAKAVGRLVINLPAILRTRPGSTVDVVLRNGDELVVPKQRQDVIVIGEVQDPTSHLYLRSMSRDDYIDQSGGLTNQADKHHIYIVRADGSVVTGSRGWFRASDSVEIRPGDAIVVPLNAEKLPALIVWQSATSILYNLAIAAIALHSF